jgi:hypothetical protein
MYVDIVRTASSFSNQLEASPAPTIACAVARDLGPALLPGFLSVFPGLGYLLCFACSAVSALGAGSGVFQHSETMQQRSGNHRKEDCNATLCGLTVKPDRKGFAPRTE